MLEIDVVTVGIYPSVESSVGHRGADLDLHGVHARLPRGGVHARVVDRQRHGRRIGATAAVIDLVSERRRAGCVRGHGDLQRRTTENRGDLVAGGGRSRDRGAQEVAIRVGVVVGDGKKNGTPSSGSVLVIHRGRRVVLSGALGKLVEGLLLLVLLLLGVVIGRRRDIRPVVDLLDLALNHPDRARRDVVDDHDPPIRAQSQHRRGSDIDLLHYGFVITGAPTGVRTRPAPHAVDAAVEPDRGRRRALLNGSQDLRLSTSRPDADECGRCRDEDRVLSDARLLQPALGTIRDVDHRPVREIQRTRFAVESHPLAPDSSHVELGVP